MNHNAILRKKLMFVMVLIFLFALHFLISFEDVSYSDEIFFSCESGFYDDEFDLTLSATEGTIFYTLDGSKPTKDSLQYTGPIHISDASGCPNVYSMRTDTSPAYDIDTLEQYNREEYPAYMNPAFPIDKCTVVRAVIYYGGDRYSDIRTSSYFVGFSDKAGYDHMSILSIVSDPDYLFDYEDGIYVTGKRYDEFVASELGQEGCIGSEYWTMWMANYSKGIATEVPCTMTMFDEDRELVLSQDCGMRIHGGGSRAYNPKSLNLYARLEYDKETFEYDLFSNGTYPGSITLSQGGDDFNSKLRDYIVYELASDLDICTVKSRPCAMFLDGEYWGTYWITERYDESYFSVHYGQAKENVIMIKNGELEIGESGDERQWTFLMDYCLSNDLSVDQNYDYVCSQIDIDSFLDYYAVMIYVDREGDWPGSNYAVWRSRKKASDAFSDCRWRCIVFDLNSSSMWHKSYDEDTIERTMAQDPLFSGLMRSDTFKQAFLDRLLMLSESNFSESKVDSFISDYHLMMDEALQKDKERFFGDNSISNYGNVDYIGDFFDLRREYIPVMVQKYR